MLFLDIVMVLMFGNHIAAISLCASALRAMIQGGSLCCMLTLAHPDLGALAWPIT